MRFGAIDDRAGVLIKAHLVECKWAADHVAGEALSAFGIAGFAANAIVYRKARVAPLQHAPGEAGIQHALIAEEVEHLQPQRLDRPVYGYLVI